MAFKGKSTIELRNAETGELEQRVEDENMVTNAIENLVNYKRLYQFTGNNPDIANWITPLSNNCFGGLLLFEKNITEDPNIILPTADNKNIGRAAGQYSGTDKYRGTFNGTESKEINDGKGYRFVWDFPTDKGNGTIRCACLTSYAGGSVGFRSEDFDAGKTSPFINGLTASNQLANVLPQKSARTFTLPNVGSPPIGIFKENEITSISCTSGQPNLTSKVTRFQNSLFLKKSYGSQTSEKVIPTTKKLHRPNHLSTDGQKIYSVFPYDTNKLDVVTIDGQTLTMENEKTLLVQDARFYTTNSGYSSPDAVYHNGYYYVKNQQLTGYYKINALDTSDYEVIIFDGFSTSDVMYFQASSFLDYLIFSNPLTYECSYNKPSLLYYGGRLQKIMTPGLGGQLPETGYKFKTCEFVKLPYVLGTCESGNRAEILNITPFLSTINNLSTPVVKNETQTMKVTYEITEI